MVHILESLNRLENKFDNLSFPGGGGSDITTPSQYRSASQTSSASATAKVGRENAYPDGPVSVGEVRHHFHGLTLPNQVFLWPGVYVHLLNSGIPAASDLQYLLQQGPLWLINREMAKQRDPLPADIFLPSFPMNINGREQGYQSNVVFPSLTVQQIQEWSNAFFSTFNVLYPLLNRDTLMNDVVAKLMREGYGYGDTGSVLALLVFALGQVAIEGVFGRPISIVDGKPSGFRGGSLQQPPGLAMFNEARRRLGFVSSDCSLENVQILILQALYFEATARHMDFWRSASQASMACQVLIKCHNFEWASVQGDLMKRAYWACMLSEDFYHMDLDLPRTGIDALQDEVPQPDFRDAQEPHSASTVMHGERAHHHLHFLATIALRRLISRIHTVTLEMSKPTQESSEEYVGPPVPVIRELARQLDSWRALLPRPLQWTDNDKLDFPSLDPTSRRPNEPLFAPDQGPIPIGHKLNLDIVTAQLRTRFYYARFLMYRPFVYKALHFPDLMTAEDVNYCALAIRSACNWPLIMAPPMNKKRLVPHLFAWTQNCIGILLILRMTTENDCLRQVCKEQVSYEEVEQTIQLMLHWVNDARQLDGVAEWSWQILEPLFNNRNSQGR